MSTPSYFSNLVSGVPAEIKTTLSVAERHLINIPLIYRKNLAGLRSAFSVDKTVPLFGQHGTGEQQVAACAALAAGTEAGGKLLLDIPFLTMHQHQTPQFSDRVQDKTGFLKHLGNSST